MFYDNKMRQAMLVRVTKCKKCGKFFAKSIEEFWKKRYNGKGFLAIPIFKNEGETSQQMYK